MDENTIETTNETGGKLKSRKFWVTIAVAAYFALMAMREQGVDSLAGRIIYGILAAAVVIIYLWIEGRLDSDHIIANSEITEAEIIEEEEEETEEAA